MKNWRIGWGALLAGLGLAASVWACQVPVFRFALERWSPDPYRLMVALGPGGSLSEDETAVVDVLKNAWEPEGLSANLIVSEPEKGENASAAARLELRYPQKYWGQDMPAVWSGELTRENAKRILDSPLRRELAKRLLSGESAVWVLVESGEPEADRLAEETLRTASAEVKEHMQIPEDVVHLDALERGEAGMPVDPDNVLRAPVPLKIEFSTLRLSRKDPEEQILLAMLLQLEKDLSQMADQPMAFPVFGRGRVLEPLIGAGIHRDNVLDYASYLCGACSCQVKDQNPGMDLLICAGWDAALDGSETVVDKVLPPLEGVAALLGVAAPETVPGEQALEAEAAVPEGGSKTLRFPTMLAAALGAVLLAIALGTAILLLRPKRGG